MKSEPLNATVATATSASRTDKATIWSDPFPLRRGSTEFLLAPRELAVKKIRVDGQLLIEAIYVAVRNEIWDTGRIELRAAGIRALPDGDVGIEWQAEVSLPDRSNEQVVYAWTISLRLGAQGLRFEAHGEAQEDFLRNRIGICVLLPDLLAGCECEVEHSQTSSKSEASSRLPVDIAPHQPIFDIAGLQVETPTTGLTLAFAGEVFEMEDQRNWTDASYKIYSTPLALPVPVKVSAGDILTQSVEAQWTANRARPGIVSASRIAGQPEADFCVNWQEIAQPLTAIGIRLAGAEIPAGLHDLRPAFVQLELDAEEWRAREPELLARLDKALREIHKTWGRSVDIAVAVRQPLAMTGADWTALKTFVDTAAGPNHLTRAVVIVDDTPACNLGRVPRAWVEAGRAALASRTGCTLPTLCVATARYFAEINRAQAALSSLSLPSLAYGINPQVHVFGDDELFDTLRIQGVTAEQARRLAPEVHWWSVTLNPLHFAHEDERLHGDLGAAWWLGSVIAALRAGVASATWFALDGAWGIESGSPLHRIMAQVGGCMAAAQADGTQTASFVGDGVYGLRIGDRAWLANGSATPKTGWLPPERSDRAPRQVWLAGWQILNLAVES
ncbi:MAG: hypothetical protein ABI478_01750 [Propionivibrio sp.]